LICLNGLQVSVHMFFENLDLDYKYLLTQDLCQLFCGQAIKSKRWMPWRQEAMKDVVSCDKLRGAAKQALIRGFLNGETRRG
jgi:hypothetical protein